jgi:hypothetical protein
MQTKENGTRITNEIIQINNNNIETNNILNNETDYNQNNNFIETNNEFNNEINDNGLNNNENYNNK